MIETDSEKQMLENDKETVVRSDASTLNVDFENFSDTLICARNAGVIMDPESRAKVLDTFGFEGTRCAHIAVTAPEERCRLQLLRAFDAPRAGDNCVLEFVYRPVLGTGVNLDNWPIIKCYTQGGAPGAFEAEFLNDPAFCMDGVIDENSRDIPRQVALELRANGKASEGTYNVSVAGRDRNSVCVKTGLPQAAWMRFIMHRRDAKVDLYIGTPGAEELIGTYDDLLSEGELYSMTIGNPEDPDARGSGYWDSFRAGRPLKKEGAVAAPEKSIKHVGKIAPVPPKQLKLGHEKQLLIDDWSIAKTGNIKRTFHRPEKHPQNPLIVSDQPWEPRLIIGMSVERMPDGMFRMWYYSGDPQPHWRKQSYCCIALSRDGVHWTKPALDMCEHNRSKDNNICFDQAAIIVVTDAEDPRPEFRYVGKIRHQGTQGVSSPDGLHWTNHGVIIPQSLDASSVHWDPVRSKYVASIKLGYKNRRFRGYAESDDFLHWTDSYLMMDVDELDVNGDQIYSLSMFRYESLYLGMCKIYHVGTTDTCDIQLAVSHNCMHWQRPYRMLTGSKFAMKENIEINYPDPHTQPFIPSAKPGSWEYGNMDPVSTPPVRNGDKLYFYYSGRVENHSGKLPEGMTWQGGCGAIGLATLRLDGFVSADADASGGFLITKPMVFDGGDLYINADAAAGEIKVEVLDEGMQPVPGFAFSNTKPITSDRVRVKCSWDEGKNISALAEKPVCLKFHLTKARLFAFWCE